jgi:hypothetical protein
MDQGDLNGIGLSRTTIGIDGGINRNSGRYVLRGQSSKAVIQAMSSNLITIEFADKTNYPEGVWKKTEPDLCHWFRYTYPCLTLRDPTLGHWQGFVGIAEEHPLFGKNLPKLLEDKRFLQLQVHEGIGFSGKMTKQKKYFEGYWVLGFATLGSSDFLPLWKEPPIEDKNKIVEIKTYKDIHFVRREVNDLARQLFAIERDAK